jgi:hypothetical protein
VTLPGAFRLHVPGILEAIGNAPLLLLLDPIGLKTIRAADWQPLLDRRAKTDLFIVLHFSVVHRTGGMLLPDGTTKPTILTARRTAAMLDGVFRGDEWRAIAIDPALVGEEHREERERRYVDLYFRNVIGIRHRWKCAFGVRAGYAAPVKYWLVHASDDLKPYTLMNDQIVELNEILYEREFAGEGQLDGFSGLAIAAEREHVMRDLEAAILACVEQSGGGQLPFGAIRDQLIGVFFGRVKQGAYWNVTKALVKEGRLQREKRAAAGVDERELISIPEPPANAPEGAQIIPINRVA